MLLVQKEGLKAGRLKFNSVNIYVSYTLLRVGDTEMEKLIE